MTSHIVGDALTRTETFSGWTVTVAEYPKGVARIDHRPRLTQVVVSDQLDDEPDGPDPCYAAAACTPEGELLVAVRCAPPALVVAPTGCRTRPSDGSGHDSEFPLPSERLILLSCGAFEAVSELLVEGVCTTPDRLLDEDPEALLIALLGQGGIGAGAVIDHHAKKGTP